MRGDPAAELSLRFPATACHVRTRSAAGRLAGRSCALTLPARTPGLACEVSQARACIEARRSRRAERARDSARAARLLCELSHSQRSSMPAPHAPTHALGYPQRVKGCEPNPVERNDKQAMAQNLGEAGGRDSADGWWLGMSARGTRTSACRAAAGSAHLTCMVCISCRAMKALSICGGGMLAKNNLRDTIACAHGIELGIG